MTNHQHKWIFVDAAKEVWVPSGKRVNLPPRRVCLRCGITQILTADLDRYPEVREEMARSPDKLIGALA